jgi:hypothetical protein
LLLSPSFPRQWIDPGRRRATFPSDLLEDAPPAHLAGQSGAPMASTLPTGVDVISPALIIASPASAPWNRVDRCPSPCRFVVGSPHENAASRDDGPRRPGGNNGHGDASGLGCRPNPALPDAKDQTVDWVNSELLRSEPGGGESSSIARCVRVQPLHVPAGTYIHCLARLISSRARDTLIDIGLGPVAIRRPPPVLRRASFQLMA